MAGKLIIEILILWIIYAGYMAVLVHKRGPLGGIFFYPKVMQERVIEMGLMTRQELRSRRSFAYILLLALIIFVPGIMILRICFRAPVSLIVAMTITLMINRINRIVATTPQAMRTPSE